MTKVGLDGATLFVRLRRVLGLSGLAGLSMASGPCGTCDQEQHACFDRADLVKQRAAAVGNFTGAAGESDGGAGTAGEGGQGDVSLAPDGNLAAASSWDPANGCPTPDQLNAILQLNDPTSYGLAFLESDANGKCCYETPKMCYGGRPFLVAGRARLASLNALPSAPEEQRGADFDQALRESWLADALMEHASVASFARLTLRLMALGAPMPLIAASQRASLDELQHASFCFERAALLGGAAWPGPLRMDDALGAESFAELLRSNLLEGCIGETLAAVRMGEQSRRSGDAALQAGLAAIGEDEACHAELAFRVLTWCLELDPVLTRKEIARVLSDTERQFHLAHANENATNDHLQRLDTTGGSRWAAAGRLSLAEGAQLDALTWRSTLAPVFRELLVTSTSSSTQASAIS